MKHTTNIYINCPYSEKDECKQLGARWDSQNRQWYIPAGLDTEPFQKWIDASSIIEKKKVSARTYLEVDFHENTVVNNMGALWDANAKRWYITEHHNADDFKFWTVCENEEQEIEEEQEVEEEENLTAEDYIDDIYDHINTLYDLIPEDQTIKTNEQEDTLELLEKKETPQEEYSRLLEEIKKEASSDKSTYHQIFRISPESLALIYMSDDNKKYLVN